MTIHRALPRTLLLGALLSLGACSGEDAKDALGGTSPAGSGGTLEIVSCSLGCSTFQTSQISCTLNDVFVNGEVRIEFSQAVDLASLGQGSFRVTETVVGNSPPGTFSLDPANPRIVIYRPLLTFDSGGSPVFGLEQGKSYEIFLPGATSGDTGPYVMSQGQRPLGVRMRCKVTAGSGVNDPVPGPPTAQVRVNPILKDGMGNPVVDPMTGIPFLGPVVLADNQTDIHRRSNISITFNDVMNPATLVNPVTKQSPSIRLFVDPDGNITDPTDQVELFGQFTISIDQTLLRTTVTFDPSTDFPSAGPLSQPLPRRIVALLPSTITDLGGNPLANAGSVSFVPERLLFPPSVLPRAGGEQFDSVFGDSDHGEDVAATGAFWGPRLTGVELLIPGLGGGSGRLGDLRVPAGEVLTLYTDGRRPAVSVSGTTCVGQAVDAMGTALFVDQLFGPAALVHMASVPETSVPCPGNAMAAPPIPALLFDSRNITTAIIDSYDPATDLPGEVAFAVRNGLFEFASLTVEPGAVLRFVGPNAARVYVRGQAVVRGRIELNGKDGTQLFDPQTNAGGAGGAAGAGGGAGGRGGLRPSGGGDLSTVNNATPNPLITAISQANGQPGGSVPAPSGTPGAPLMVGGGPGGTRWPNATTCATPAMTCDFPPTTNPGLTNFGGIAFDFFFSCDNRMPGGPGGGGGKRTSGGAGTTTYPSSVVPPNALPPVTMGGTYPFDTTNGISLRAELGFLTGGGGGGGAGANPIGTQRLSLPFQGCVGSFTSFRTNSGAGGGGGGGAIQLQAGSRVVIDGVIDASGGRGGQPRIATSIVEIVPTAASPGGSGAGGSILVQALDLQLAAVAGRLNVSGGLGTVGTLSSTGGAGSVGFVRVEAGRPENNSVPAFSSIAQRVAPVPSTNPATPGTWLSTTTSGFQPMGAGLFVNQPHPLTGVPMTYFPDVFTGGQSCWMRPPGNFFRLNFDDDQPNDPGWNMIVTMLDLTSTPPSLTSVPYRGTPGDPGYATTIEGGYLAFDGVVSMLQDPGFAMAPPTFGSPFVVRFQGARAVDEIADLCAIPLSGEQSPIQPDSLTPWVLHPVELNTYWDAVFPSDPGEVSKRRPNLVRYQITFNSLSAIVTGLSFLGVDQVAIQVQPD